MCPLSLPESYQEYLEIIYRLSLQNPGGWVKNKDISDRLQVKAPSTSSMLEKLTAKGLIEWVPRSGIRLTEKGKEDAKILIRNHIIIEVFMMNILKITDPTELNKIACDFEHHITPDIAQKMQDLLGIDDYVRNVDNFIMEDKLPSHIQTTPIYSERKIKNALSVAESQMDIKKFPIEDQERIKLALQSFWTSLKT